MGQVRTSRPSAAIIIAVVALVAALAGTAIAGPGATTSALTKPKLKKIVKKQINKLAPGLSVANANTLEGKQASAFASSTSEPYQEVGAAGEPGFQNGWANLGSPYSTAAFYQDPLGVVHLKGTLSPGTNGIVAFTLPPGYRPSQDLLMAAGAGGIDATQVSQVLVRADGSVDPACGGSPCTVGIDGLTFRPQ